MADYKSLYTLQADCKSAGTFRVPIAGGLQIQLNNLGCHCRRIANPPEHFRVPVAGGLQIRLNI